MKRTGKIALVVLVGTLAISGAAIAARQSCFSSEGGHHAWFSGPSPQEKAGWMVSRVSERLELNANQRAKLIELKEMLLAIRKDALSRKENTRSGVLELLQTPVLDKARAIDMVNAKLQMVQANAPEVLVAIAGFTDTLDMEQKQMLTQRLSQRKPFRENRF